MTNSVTLPTEHVEKVMMLAAYYNVSQAIIVKRAIEDYVAKERDWDDIEVWWEVVKNDNSQKP